MRDGADLDLLSSWLFLRIPSNGKSSPFCTTLSGGMSFCFFQAPNNQLGWKLVLWVRVVGLDSDWIPPKMKRHCYLAAPLPKHRGGPQTTNFRGSTHQDRKLHGKINYPKDWQVIDCPLVMSRVSPNFLGQRFKWLWQTPIFCISWNEQLWGETSNSEVMDEQLWGDGWATLRWWMSNSEVMDDK